MLHRAREKTEERVSPVSEETETRKDENERERERLLKVEKQAGEVGHSHVPMLFLCIFYYRDLNARRA